MRVRVSTAITDTIVTAAKEQSDTSSTQLCHAVTNSTSVALGNLQRIRLGEDNVANQAHSLFIVTIRSAKNLR
jgi:hypothetical protein